MDCVSVIVTSLLSSLGGMVDAILGFLRSLGAEGIGNLLNLEKNTEALEREMKELKEIRDDLEIKVRNLERQPRMRRTQQVSGWLKRVEALNDKVLSLQDSMEGRPTLFESCSFDSLQSRCSLGSEAADLLKAVRELSSQQGGLLNDRQLVDEAPPDRVVLVPRKSNRIVGGEKALSEIQGHLRNEKVGIIGIYGMGGVGKTTLLTEINHQFIEKENCCDFDVVIWVTISSEPSVYKIQEDIGVRLGFPRQEDKFGGSQPLPENKDDRRSTLYGVLHQKKFLLLLDDIWEKLELDAIGIPHPNVEKKDGKKIVFTTRSEVVCSDMDVQGAKVRVGFLDEEKSWQLFCSKVDAKLDLDNKPDILPHAETVVRKCGGLPLALITMGRAMSNASDVAEWRQAVEKLKESPDKIRGMHDVLSILKFSFDKLEDDITRECLLYCALFPEDHRIVIEDLVEYWVGEGFLDADSSVRSRLFEARDRGKCIIRKLTDASLLENSGNTIVRMHDVIREMAIWLTGEQCEKKKRFVICSGEKGSVQLRESTTWEDANRISIVKECTLQLPSLEGPRCSKLLTMLISRRFSTPSSTFVKGWSIVAQNFCESMLSLRVLDLSGADIEDLPDAFGMLSELRYLNLSFTNIKQLPKGLGRLVKLRQLYLSYTRKLTRIPREAMLTLEGLQTLNVYASRYSCWDDNDEESDGIKLSDVEYSLVRLEELYINICTLSCVERLAKSEKFQKCARRIKLAGVVDVTSHHLSAIVNKCEQLTWLVIEDCSQLEEWRVDCSSQPGRLDHLLLRGLPKLEEVVVVGIEGVHTINNNNTLRRGGRRGGQSLLRQPFSSLVVLSIMECPRLKDVRWVGELRHLRQLMLSNCDGVEELLAGDEQGGEEVDHCYDHHCSSFSKLRIMTLRHLTALRSISRRPLLFPSLAFLDIHNCPQLKRLPFGHQSCKKIKRIGGNPKWWDALVWGDDDANTPSSSGGNGGGRGCGIKSALDPFFEPLPESIGLLGLRNMGRSWLSPLLRMLPLLLLMCAL